jgi:hypothetical protein
MAMVRLAWFDPSNPDEDVEFVPDAYQPISFAEARAIALTYNEFASHAAGMHRLLGLFGPQLSPNVGGVQPDVIAERGRQVRVAKHSLQRERTDLDRPARSE